MLLLLVGYANLFARCLEQKTRARWKTVTGKKADFFNRLIALALSLLFLNLYE
jgi:hypothetical protein